MADETEQPEWVVRIERRRDGRFYFFDHRGNCNARRASSMRLDKETAAQLAHAIATQHPYFTARAMRYDSPVHALRSCGPTGPKEEQESKTNENAQ